MKTFLNTTLGTLAVVNLALAGVASGTNLFSVDFSTYANGTTYSSTFVPGGPVVTTDSGLVGTGAGKVTAAFPVPASQPVNNPTWSGGWSAVVQGNMLKMSATNINGNGGGVRVVKNQAAPASAQTWFVQFDYTKLATTSGLLGVNFLNASGQNMLGHPNTATLSPTKWANSLTLANGTYLLRLEVDSGTTTARAYVNNVLVSTMTASNTTTFGGISFNIIQGNATDFLIGKISGGIVGP